MPDNDPTKYYLRSGTVHAYVYREKPHFMHFFGFAEYDRSRPIISERKRTEVQPILDKLNSGEMSEDEAKRELDKIW